MPCLEAVEFSVPVYSYSAKYKLPWEAILKGWKVGESFANGFRLMEKLARKKVVCTTYEVDLVVPYSLQHVN